MKDPTTLRRELDGLNLRSLGPEEQELWYRVRGTLEYRIGNRSAALNLYERGLTAFPASPVLQFSCAQEYEDLGQIERARSLFQRIDLQAAGGRYSLEIARYLYLWDFLEDADKTLQWIFDAYYELEVADDNFLSMRNLPFYSTTFGCRATFAILRGRPDAARRELDKSARLLHDYNFEHLRLVLEATLSGDWSAVLSRLRESLEKSSQDPGHGYLALKYAVLKVQSARSPEEAYSLLDSILLGPHDLGWIADVRVLAKARAARQFGNVDAEQHWLTTFFERQPHLFEPFNAFEFGLVQYQESLKPLYQARRADPAAPMK